MKHRISSLLIKTVDGLKSKNSIIGIVHKYRYHITFELMPRYIAIVFKHFVMVKCF